MTTQDLHAPISSATEPVGFWRSLRVGPKLTFVSAIFGGAILFLIGTTYLVLENQQADALQTDAMGRQRFLAQRYVLDAMLASDGMRTNYQETKAIFDRNLVSLLDGGPVTVEADAGLAVNMPPPPTPAIRQELLVQHTAAAELDQAILNYLQLSNADQTSLAVMEGLRERLGRVTQSADRAAKLYANYTRSRVQDQILMVILVGALAAAAGLTSMWLVARSIVSPLRQCADLARGIADGDLRAAELPVRSRDEVGILTAAFNDMLRSLRSITGETRGNAERLGAAVAQILASVQEQAASTKQQAAAVQEITSTVEQIGQSAQQVSDMARQVGGEAQGVADSGRSGLHAVQEAVAAMEAIRAQTGNVAETIVALSERTQAVGEIIATVNEIAEQSNLVALNAAIEAADAGDQGRRFSVVANEIKALADQAKDATKQVRGILEQTQKGINTSVMLTEEALKRVTAGREKAVAAEDVIRRMADSIQESSGSFQQVVGATGQQQIGLEQIAQGLQQIRQASLQTAASTDQLARASANLSQLGEALTGAIEKYRL